MSSSRSFQSDGNYRENRAKPRKDEMVANRAKERSNDYVINANNCL